MKHILISGGSGLIGSALTALLTAAGYEVAWLSRHAGDDGGQKIFLWDIEKKYIDENALRWADSIIHLAGEGITEKRWTPTQKRKIIESRTAATELLIEKLKLSPGSVTKVIAASAIGFYGENKNGGGNEDDAHGSGFLSESVVAWENATAKFETVVPFVTRIRIGIVLSEKGGALKELRKTEKFGILPILGKGKQQYSWIHIDDVCGIFLFALQNSLSGIYNAVAPQSVDQKTLMKTIKNVKRGAALLIPVPAFVLKIMLGEMSKTILISQHVSNNKIMQAGYNFKFPAIGDAITDLIKKPGR